MALVNHAQLLNLVQQRQSVGVKPELKALKSYGRLLSKRASAVEPSGRPSP